MCALWIAIASGNDPNHARCVLIVSWQTLCDPKPDKVVCAAINTNEHGWSTEVAVGICEGLKHE